jgi:uncharacterized membrane protein
MYSDTILQVSATMIVGILFVATIAEALKVKAWVVGRWLFLFCLVGTIPFTVTTVLDLLDMTQTKIACIVSFILFCATFTLISYAITVGLNPSQRQNLAG